VDDGHHLGVGSGNTVDGGELTDTEGGDEGGDALYTGITISGIGYIGNVY